MHIEIRENIEFRKNGGFATDTKDFRGFSIYLMQNSIDGTFLYGYEYVHANDSLKILEEAMKYASKVCGIINMEAGKICRIEHVIYKQKIQTTMIESSRTVLMS